MNKQLQTVYISTKAENELPNKEGYYFSNDDEKEDIHWFGKWFGSGIIRHFLPKTWLKPTESYVFTPDELKELLEDYTNKIVENAEVEFEEGYGMVAWVDKKSITNQLPLMLKELGL